MTTQASPTPPPSATQTPRPVVTSAPLGSRPPISKVVKKGVNVSPLRILIYGPGGVGKTSFSNGAPDTIFLHTEDGFGKLDHAQLPQVKDWDDVLGYIRQLTVEDHDFKTLAIDTIDGVEELLFAEICRAEGVNSIEKVGGGFNKGYVAATEKLRTLIAALEALRRVKKMHIILVAHSKVRNFKNPLGDDYNRIVVNMHPDLAGVISNWVDINLFANQETVAVKTKGATKARGVSTGARYLNTEFRAGWDGKNRYSLPAKLPLEWKAFYAALQVPPVEEIANLRKEIAAKMEFIKDATVQATIRGWIATESIPVDDLRSGLNRVNVILTEQPQDEVVEEAASGQ